MVFSLRQVFCPWARIGTRRGTQPPAVRRLECEVLEDRLLPSLTGAQLFANSLPAAAQAVVASAPDGRAVVAWTVEKTPADHDIHAQRFDASGHKVGPELLVAGSREDQYHPAVAMNARGDFVVAWVMTFFRSDTDIDASVFRADGSRIADDVPVAWSYKAEFDPSVSMNARGDFVVSYTLQFGPADTDVKAALFDAGGIFARTIDVASTTRAEGHSHVALGEDGSFAVSYTSNGTPMLQTFPNTLLPPDGAGTSGGQDGGNGEHRLPPPRHQRPTLSGILFGGVVAGPASHDAGSSYDLAAIGDLAGLGETLLTGDLRSPGFIASGHASGELTLTSRRGTVRLDLEGPSQRGFARLPQRFHFTVEAGTGAFRHLHESGIAILHLSPVFHTLTIDLKPAVA